MAAVTSTILALGGLGLSAGQAIKGAFKAYKSAGLDPNNFSDFVSKANDKGYSLEEMGTIFNSGFDFSGTNDWFGSEGVFSDKIQ